VGELYQPVGPAAAGDDAFGATAGSADEPGPAVRPYAAYERRPAVEEPPPLDVDPVVGDPAAFFGTDEADYSRPARFPTVAPSETPEAVDLGFFEPEPLAEPAPTGSGAGWAEPVLSDAGAGAPGETEVWPEAGVPPEEAVDPAGLADPVDDTDPPTAALGLGLGVPPATPGSVGSGSANSAGSAAPSVRPVPPVAPGSSKPSSWPALDPTFAAGPVTFPRPGEGGRGGGYEESPTPADGPTAAEPEPVVEEPIVEEAIVEEAAIEEPVAVESATGEPVVEEPAIEEPAAVESATGEPVVEEPAIEESAAVESATEEPVVEEPAAREQAPIEAPGPVDGGPTASAGADTASGTAASASAAGVLALVKGAGEDPSDVGAMAAGPLLLHSLTELRDVWVPLVTATDPSSVAEIGSETGITTSLLFELLRVRGGGRLLIVDPDPGLEPADDGPVSVEVVRGYSPQALEGHAVCDAYLVDGDHNYPTVRGELAAIERASQEAGRDHMPLIILHDVGWPAGRRDQYYAPDRINEAERQPHSWDVGVRVGDPGAAPGGFRGEGAFAWALTEGGDHNGVRSAIEDFIAAREHLRLHVVAPVFGLGVLVDRRAPWARRLEGLLRPWTDNPLLARLERNRLELYLAVIRLQDEASALARRRQREWTRLEAERGERAARELALLDRVAAMERELAAVRAEADGLRAVIRNEPAVAKAARHARDAWRLSRGQDVDAIPGERPREALGSTSFARELARQARSALPERQGRG